jgi:hypothetical protein
MRTRLILAFDGSPSSVHASELLAAHAQGTLLEALLLNARPRGARLRARLGGAARRA